MATSLYRHAHTRFLLFAAVLLGAFAAALAAAPSASAHDELVSSTPADGSVLEAAPAEIALVFSSELMDLGNQVIVVDAAGTTVAEGEPVLNRETLVQALPALENGDYQVNWRAVSGDGHPITGTFSFTVASPEAEPAATPATSQAAGTASSAPAVASASAEPSDAAAEDASSVGSHVPWALAGAAVGAAAALAAWAIVVQVRKRRGNHS